MFRAGLYARVSTNDQQTLPMQILYACVEQGSQTASMLSTMHLKRLLLLVVVPLVAGAAAQTAARSPKPSDNSDDIVLKAPYSARRRFTSVEKLADGTTRRTETGGSEARDSEGRTYSAGERLWTYLDHGTPVLKSEMLYRIYDPVANAETKWDSTSKQVKVIHWPARTVGATAVNPFNAFFDPSPGDVVEKLGASTIEGVVAEGTRSTYTVSIEKNTRSKELRVVHERWYCPKLKTVVLETNDDPRSGTWRNELVDIAPGEPDVAKYRPPSDYVINDVRVPVR